MARALLLLLLLLVGYRGAEAIRVVPHGAARGQARNQSHGHRHRHSHGGGRAAMPRNAMPLVGTRPLPVRLPPAGSAEENKRRIPSCPDPLHNR